jgi:signal transduction histidine kinase
MTNTAYENGKPAHIIEEFVDRNSNSKFIYRAVFPLLNEQQEVERVIVYGLDITQQVADKNFAITQERRIDNLLQIISDGVFRCNEAGIVNLYNNSFLRIMNIQERNQKTWSINFFDLLPPDVSTKLKNEVALLNPDGKTITGQFNLAATDGTERIIEYLFSPVMRAEDAAFLGRITDITDQVNKEKYYHQMLQKEKELNISKSSFLRIASHELRTPLSIIQTNNDLLELFLQAKDTSRVRFDPKVVLARINKEVLHMTEILNNMISVGRIETDKVTFNIEIVDILDFLNDIIASMYAPYKDGRYLELDIGEKTRYIAADRQLLRNIIVNLVNNAFKYSSGKRAPILSISEDDDNYQISVRDFGIGIPEKDKPKLFNSFFRASNVGSIKGTGIGLTVIEYAVKKHKGSVEVQSEENAGTKFNIKLPKTLPQ